MPPFLKIALLLAGGLLALGAAAYYYLAYAPLPDEPTLSARIQPATLRVGDRLRSYLAYVPAGLPRDAPLVLVLHGSNIDGATMRRWTGCEFDQLADKHKFIVLYPDGYQKNWNDCRRDVSFPAKTENIDDVGFLRALVARFQAEHGSAPEKVYAFGFSNGGLMAFRLASEAPGLLAAMATAGANLPEPASSSCPPPSGPTPRVLLVAGTADPVCPYAGGQLTLFGLKRGRVISAPATAETFVRCNGLTAAPVVTTLPPQLPDDPTTVERRVWARDNESVVELYTVRGGGHVVPQPTFRFPRLMGRTTSNLDAPAQALRFFGLFNSPSSFD